MRISDDISLAFKPKKPLIYSNINIEIFQILVMNIILYKVIHNMLITRVISKLKSGDCVLLCE